MENEHSKIPMKTEVKEGVILAVLYIVAATSWLNGWFCLGMRLEYLFTLLIIVILWSEWETMALLSSYVKKHMGA
ncbi:MAG: hypothetical protein GY795_46515 [Desulfobacterales bacterium]|nr:hypothetical protein [Desulfobacterales bacterium]